LLLQNRAVEAGRETRRVSPVRWSPGELPAESTELGAPERYATVTISF
jgi:hypothetical protein